MKLDVICLCGLALWTFAIDNGLLNIICADALHSSRNFKLAPLCLTYALPFSVDRRVCAGKVPFWWQWLPTPF